jgi:DNA-binding NarL/FixJ family response regulator
MDALHITANLFDNQKEVAQLMAGQNSLVAVGSRLMALVWVQAHRGPLVGVVTKQSEALDLFLSMKPSLLIATQHLEEGNGLELIKIAKAENPNLHTLLFLQHEHPFLYEQAAETHADGILVETLMGRGHLLHALRNVCDGGVFLDPEVSMAIHGTRPSSEHGLTRRELEIMQEVVHGYNDRTIASDLRLSTETVRSYLKRIYLKLGLHNRTRAAVAVLLLGLVEPPRPLLPAKLVT